MVVPWVKVYAAISEPIIQPDCRKVNKKAVLLFANKRTAKRE
jgi:hypothetical protein